MNIRNDMHFWNAVKSGDYAVLRQCIGRERVFFSLDARVTSVLGLVFPQWVELDLTSAEEPLRLGAHGREWAVSLYSTGRVRLRGGSFVNEPLCQYLMPHWPTLLCNCVSYGLLYNTADTGNRKLSSCAINLHTATTLETWRQPGPSIAAPDSSATAGCMIDANGLRVETWKTATQSYSLRRYMHLLGEEGKVSSTLGYKDNNGSCYRVSLAYEATEGFLLCVHKDVGVDKSNGAAIFTGSRILEVLDPEDPVTPLLWAGLSSDWKRVDSDTYRVRQTFPAVRGLT